MQSRPAPEQGGEEEEAEGHGQVPLGPRHQREDPGGGFQRGLRGAEEITPHFAPGQETLQDRDPQTGYLLHLLSQSRVGCLKVPPVPAHETEMFGLIGLRRMLGVNWVWQGWQLQGRLMTGIFKADTRYFFIAFYSLADILCKHSPPLNLSIHPQLSIISNRPN